jgi:hypothetical protein
MKSLFFTGLFAKVFRLETKATPKSQPNVGVGKLRDGSQSRTNGDWSIQVRRQPVFSTDSSLFMRSQLG